VSHDGEQVVHQARGIDRHLRDRVGVRVRVKVNTSTLVRVRVRINTSMLVRVRV